jgi:hypothetical protein
MSTSTELPLFNDPVYEYSTSLDGVSFRLLFVWNTYSQTWYLSVEDVNGNPIVSGVPIVTNYPLLIDYDLSEHGLYGSFLFTPITPLGLSPDIPNMRNMDKYVKLFYISKG